MNEQNIIDQLYESSDDGFSEEKRPAAIVCGSLITESVNDCLESAAKLPNPKPLFDVFWAEGEIACLFASTNVGKSLLAVQIGKTIAEERGLNVLYVDFELDKKQFQQRYSDEHGHLFKFPSGFFRSYSDYQQTGQMVTPETILIDIAESAKHNSCSVVIIDNLTWICGNSEKAAEAAEFMKRLVELKMKMNLSVLVIAHTPKRDGESLLAWTDLAGSSQLANFFDSIFALGKSVREGGENVRYLKQIKVRNAAAVYTTDNVLALRIVKKSQMVEMEKFGTYSERAFLKADKNEERNNAIFDLQAAGKPIRSIAEEISQQYGHISKSAVQKILKNGQKVDKSGQGGQGGQSV